MREERVAEAIIRRASLAGVGVSSPTAASLAAYLALLARWNRTINLTALEVSPPSDVAIDRLIVEPLAAAALLRDADRSVVDIGSGGGSPAIPLKIVRPDLRFVLVEMKVRKSAFLREAIRHLSLRDIDVETTRVEELAGRDAMRERFDVATLRAVRADRGVSSAIHQLLGPGGRLLWFGGAPEIAPHGFRLNAASSANVPSGHVVVLQRVDSQSR